MTDMTFRHVRCAWFNLVEECAKGEVLFPTRPELHDVIQRAYEGDECEVMPHTQCIIRASLDYEDDNQESIGTANNGDRTFRQEGTLYLQVDVSRPDTGWIFYDELSQCLDERLACRNLPVYTMYDNQGNPTGPLLGKVHISGIIPNGPVPIADQDRDEIILYHQSIIAIQFYYFKTPKKA